MPLQKPSPHRFIAPHPPSTQTPKAKPKSNLRHAVTAQTPKQAPELQFKKITPAKRFVVASTTPRLHTADGNHAPDRVEEPGSSASTDYTPRPKAQRKLERVESIEEASQSSPSRGTDGDALDVLQTVEHGFEFVEEGDEHRSNDSDDEDNEILFESHPRSKRRRTSSPTTPLRHQPLPDPALPSAAPHRFRFAPAATTPNTLHTSATTPATTTTITPAPPRPHFLLPAQPTSPETPPTALPELFSPSRKTQKYLPGGLASTVQRWIIEAAQTGFAAREIRGAAWEGGGGRVPEREEGVKFKFRVSSLSAQDVEGQEVRCLPGTTTFLRGDVQLAADGVAGLGVEGTQEGRETLETQVKVLLAGQGGARGAAGVQVSVGCVVGLRAPTWEVCVGGVEWVVGVDWVVL